ncbi:acyltransferase [Aeromicrobium sp.]|uniref:acyltransferase n=1 Tax=Aeromicrobium sp. TaxID=1871063 RepID=UPI003C46C4AE
MDGTLEDGMHVRHRDRLRAAGVEATALDALSWRRVLEPLPDWWHDHGNALYLGAGASLPDHVLAALITYPVRDVLIAVGSPMDWLSSLLVGGDGATIFLDRRCALTAGELYCGGGSSIVLHGPVVATRSAIVDARNGGTIVAQADQLWAADVYIATDDMHRLQDRRTGERINPYGAHIRLGRHVWLCRDAVVTGHAEIGDGAVVGMRSMVRGQKVPPNAVAAGSPARIVREDVAWTLDDLP